jgi:hypothetical protein
VENDKGDKYYLLSWDRLVGGVYLCFGGRFKISRRGSGKWILTDHTTSEQMRFKQLCEAQARAEQILNDHHNQGVAKISMSIGKTESWTYLCKKGTVKLHFAYDETLGQYDSRPGLASVVQVFDSSSHLVCSYSRTQLGWLHLVTRKFRIEIIPVDVQESTISATVSASDALKLMGESGPTDDTYDLILNLVSEHRKSSDGELHEQICLTAQGQTKKPGSHSHDKHK